MIFTWKDYPDYIVERPVGLHVVGLNHKGFRPDNVEFSQKDLLDFSNLRRSHLEYYILMLSGALRKER
jgi:hypothetical protein